MRNKQLIITTAIVLVAGLLVGGYLFVNRGDSSGKMRIKNYQTGVCAVLSPECGYCTGEVVNGECLVTKEELAEYKKMYPHVETN